MLTPPPLPQSNAQRTENIQRRHELLAIQNSVEGLTAKQEQELSDLYDRLEAYDKVSFPCTTCTLTPHIPPSHAHSSPTPPVQRAEVGKPG